MRYWSHTQRLESLDCAVAYYAGPMEGLDQYGAKDVSGSIMHLFVYHGKLLYSRSKQFYSAFDSCQGKDDSKWKVAIMVAIFGSCRGPAKQHVTPKLAAT